MTNVIDFTQASEKVKVLRKNGQISKLKEEETYEYDFADEYAYIAEELLWFFFLLSDDENYDTWDPPLQVKMLMLIFEGVIFQLLGENSEGPSIFVQNIIDKMGVQEIEEVHI